MAKLSKAQKAQKGLKKQKAIGNIKMKPIAQIKLNPKIRDDHGKRRQAELPTLPLKTTYRKETMLVIFSWGRLGSCQRVLRERTPSWDEMCELKEIFFSPDETVVQFHARRAKYINYHQHCLHLWKKQGSRYDLPPGWMVGPKPGGQTEEECRMEALVALEGK